PLIAASRDRNGERGARKPQACGFCAFLKCHTTKDIAQVTALGATASRIVPVSTRPNKQNRSARSSMPLLYPLCRARYMNQFTERPIRKQPAVRRCRAQNDSAPRPVSAKTKPISLEQDLRIRRLR